MLPGPPPFPETEGCLCLGTARVEVATREIRMPDGRLRRVTPKAMAVLLALAERAGEVVSRCDLLERVWPDTLPTDDVLTQAVTQLRKAFGVQGKGYVETIAKGGYRLTVEVTVQGDVPSPVPAMPVERVAQQALGHEPAVARRRGDRGKAVAGRWVAGVAVLATLVTLAVLYWSRAADESTAVAGAADPDPPYSFVTSMPGFEQTPALSPDAALVVYSAASQGLGRSTLRIQATEPSAPSRLLVVPPVDASDTRPAWSPDGRRIAFARKYRDGRCRVLVVSAAGGSAHGVADCAGVQLLSFSWMPGSDGLLFGSTGGEQAPAGIRVLDLASGRWRSISYEPRGLDHAPAVSPDGQWIGFVRNPQLGELWRIPVQGGQAEQLTRLGGSEIRGWSWLGDSRSLVFDWQAGAQTRLSRLDLGDGRITDLGPDNGRSPSVAPAAGALAFAYRSTRFGLYRVHALAEGGVDVSAVYASSGNSTQPVISPDGHRIVFNSDRAGRSRLWWGRLDHRGGLRAIEGVVPDAQQAAAWSPDGRHLLVVGREPDSSRRGLYEVDPASGAVKRLEAPHLHLLQAAYTDDPAHVLLVARAAKDSPAALLLYDRSAQPWRLRARWSDVSHIRYDRHARRVLFTRATQSGLWALAPELSPGTLRQIDPARPGSWRYRSWALAPDGSVQYLHARRGCAVALGSLSGDTAARCIDPVRLAGLNGFSVDPLTGDAYLSLAVEDGTDIAFMPLPDDVPVRGVPGWLARRMN